MLVDLVKFGLATDTNPRFAPHEWDARKDIVFTKSRPDTVFSLFAETHFLKNPEWTTYLRQHNASYGYIEGLEKLCHFAQQGNNPMFLWNHDHYKAALETCELQSGEDWSLQLACDLSKRISDKFFRNQLKENVPLKVPKLIAVIRSCEVALDKINKKRSNASRISELWVYDYMRIRLAVYNFDYKDFDQAKLAKLRESIPDFDQKITEYCGQISPKFLNEIAKGDLATYNTVFMIREFVNAQEISIKLKLGEILAFPKHKRSKTAKPSRSEIILNKRQIP